MKGRRLLIILGGIVLAISLCCVGTFIISLFAPESEEDSITDLPPTSPNTAIPTVTQTITPTSVPSATNTWTPSPTFTPTPPFLLTVGNNTNLHMGPGGEYDPLRIAEQGELLPVYMKDETSQWLLVDPMNYIWIRSSNAILSAPIEDIPIAPTATASTTPTETLTPTVTNTFTPIPTRTPIPTNTPLPTKTPIPAVSLETIYNHFEDMTVLQFEEYKKTIAGKPVRQMVKIGNVDEKGRVILSGDWNPFIINITDFCVIVTGVPRDIAISLEGGEQAYLEAKINGIVGDYNYFFNCENTLILNYGKIE